MLDSAEFTENFKALYRFAHRLLGRAELAEEIAQEALARLAEAGYPLVGEEARRWLFVVARNLCLSHLRRASKFPEVALDDSPAPASQAPDPAQAAQAGERRRLVAEAVAALPPQLREVVVLREYEDLDYARIAEIIGCPIGTVRSRLARAREALRKRLSPILEGIQ